MTSLSLHGHVDICLLWELQKSVHTEAQMPLSQELGPDRDTGMTAQHFHKIWLVSSRILASFKGMSQKFTFFGEEINLLDWWRPQGKGDRGRREISSSAKKKIEMLLHLQNNSPLIKCFSAYCAFSLHPNRWSKQSTFYLHLYKTTEDSADERCSIRG